MRIQILYLYSHIELHHTIHSFIYQAEFQTLGDIMKKKVFMLLPLILINTLSCTEKQEDITLQTTRIPGISLPNIDISGSPNGIVPFPENTPSLFTDVFSKYTKIIAPNGKPIHFIAQDAWSDDKIVKARNIMEFILTDFPGSEYGNNKLIVANAMSDNKATMTLFNTSGSAQEAREGPFGGGTDLFTQSLWANETTVEGSDDYMNHITRDASYEEVLHLVHGSGIIPALPRYNAELLAAKDAAVARGWGPPNDDPQGWHFEYIAQQLDVYLDLWNIQPKVWEGREIKPGQMPEGTAHWGQNPSNTRARLLELDPVGYELVEKFFHPYITYTPFLPINFEGVFSIQFDETLVYTHKSQHLRNVALRGSGNVNLTGNVFDNTLTGNDGNNILIGGGGDDELDGRSGDDTAVYSGSFSEYSIDDNNQNVRVTDNTPNREGNDTLQNIEYLQFSDRRIDIN